MRVNTWGIPPERGGPIRKGTQNPRAVASHLADAVTLMVLLEHRQILPAARHLAGQPVAVVDGGAVAEHDGADRQGSGQLGGRAPARGGPNADPDAEAELVPPLGCDERGKARW